MSLTKLADPVLTSLLASKTIIIIGGTAGIGRALAISCLSRGAKVTVVGRRQPDAALANATFVQRDLASMKAATSLAADLPIDTADVLVFSAGIIAAPTRQTSPEGIELDLAVSYLNRFAIIKTLLAEKRLGAKRVAPKAKPRVFVFGYPGIKNEVKFDDFNSEKEYKTFVAHMNTVVGNEVLVKYTAESSNMAWNVYGLNPGLIVTEIRDNYFGKGTWLSWAAESLIGLFTPKAQQYADNMLAHLIVTPQLEDMNTALFDQAGKLLKPNPVLEAGDVRSRVVQESEKLLERALKA